MEFQQNRNASIYSYSESNFGPSTWKNQKNLSGDSSCVGSGRFWPGHPRHRYDGERSRLNHHASMAICSMLSFTLEWISGPVIWTEGLISPQTFPKHFGWFTIPQTFPKPGFSPQTFPNIFLPFIAHRCDKSLAFTERCAYRQDQCSATKGNHEQ
jgi:hypothetical protein